MQRRLFLLSLLLITSFFAKASERTTIFVSILPQKFFVEKIAGDKVDVNALVGPGDNPATFSPGQKTMAKLLSSSVYFSIGVPFEHAVLRKLRQLQPDLTIVATDAGITKRDISDDHHHSGEHSEEDQNKDPHIWLSPLNAKKIALNILQGLIAIDSHNKVIYTNNYNHLIADLDQLHHVLSERLRPLTNRSFLSYHPSWGYFSDLYQLKQLALETEGKPPRGKQMVHLIEQAKQQGITTILIQKQFNTALVDLFAKEINASVTVVDPLAEDYLNNLRQFSEHIAGSNL